MGKEKGHLLNNYLAGNKGHDQRAFIRRQMKVGPGEAWGVGIDRLDRKRRLKLVTY
jgi:hypothetical protein